MTDAPVATTAPAPAVVDYHRFFDLSADLFAVAGLDGRLQVVNRSFAHLLDRDASELTGRPLLDVVHPDDVATTLARQTELADPTNDTDGVVFEIRCRCRDDTYRGISWSARVDADAGVVYMVGFDVTERRIQQDVVQKLVRDLESSNADLGQFAYVASHDLSEPLRMVSSYVQLLAVRYRGQLDDDADEFIGYAVDGATRMKALIDDLLAYSRTGRVAPLRRRVDCDALMRDVLGDLRGVITDTGATVTVGSLPIVTSDAGLLAQVFQNLVANALKFVPPGQSPEVLVTGERVGAEIEFAVSDNGIGISADHQKRVFMMFKRLHTRVAYPGTGIGLAMCQQIVGRLDGRIWVESEPGSGSTFRFVLPDLDLGAAA